MFWWQSLIIAASTGTISAISTLLAIKFTNSAGDARLKNQLDAENTRAIESHANDRKLRADEARAKFERHVNDRIIEISAGLIAKAETLGSLYQSASFDLLVAQNTYKFKLDPDVSEDLSREFNEKANAHIENLLSTPLEMKIASAELRLIAPGLVEVSARELVELAEEIYPDGEPSNHRDTSDRLTDAIDKLVKATRAYIDV
ncbi:hypothetical protein [Rhodococcus qingshengii]|uniref:hypothetical protein n=1 Tax=Rhodococcus qingshengii TaxID=334542 RepID=UPI0030196D29